MTTPRLLLTRPRKRQTDFSLAIVNIVLLLIFFFMLSGSLVENDEMEVDLAHTENLPLDKLPRPLLLLYRDGHYSLDGAEMDDAALTAALTAVHPKTLNLLADRDLPASALVGFLGRPELAGTAVRLVTLHMRRAAP